MTRFYVDAFLQNVKNVAFFMYLPVLIAKLGATPFEISLSNSLPALCCAFSLAFITRQLPLTRRVYYTSGVLRQLAFLGMAFSPLLPHPVVWLLGFWVFNAMFVMITSVQQPALVKNVIDEEAVPKLFSRTKVIAIVVTVVGSYVIGRFLDVHQAIFPYNYVICMVTGAIATFTGMNIIAGLAPRERRPVRFRWVLPLRRPSRLLFAMWLASGSIAVFGPLWTIYHVNVLHLSNLQIGWFGVMSGLISTLAMPWMQKGLQRVGPRTVIVAACAVMAVVPLFYTLRREYAYILALQILLGVAFSFYDVAQQTLAVTEAKHQPDDLAFLSDYQLVQNLGNGLAPLLTAVVLAHTDARHAFIWLSCVRLATALLVGSLLFTRAPRWLWRLWPRHSSSASVSGKV
ncbi:MFS transporter [Alicyclobacillus cellulosilyticus]|nr:MFS transporter [Alicyclobacillus cellulosilyticus]